MKKTIKKKEQTKITGSKPKLPYLEKIDERGNLQIWLVDGSYIRTHIDEEFTNFGQHYRFPWIPKNELWIEKKANADERRFFIEHLLIEHRLMENGLPYDKALEEAGRVERRERSRAGDVRRLTHQGKQSPDGKEVHQRLWKKLQNGVSVWIVNGRLVRSVFDVHFTEGGHDHLYEFVPENEVWIDDALEEKEWSYVLLQELHERNRMASGWPYNKAHAESIRIKHRCRHNSDELHKALVVEGSE